MSEKNTDTSATGAASTPEHAPADDAEAGLRADLAEVIARLTAEPAEAERTLAAVRRLLG